jgi:hypothetical protein
MTIGSPDRPFARIKGNKGDIRIFETLRQLIYTRLKQMYGDNASAKLFDNPVIILNKDEISKMEKFVDYCNNNLMCANCNKKPAMEVVRSEADSLAFTCEKCYGTTIDATKEAQDYVKWFSNILSRFSTTFDKMPNLIVAEEKDRFHEWVSSIYTGDYKIKISK